jgi:peptidoglycan/xylan/chitin deacetylase (PgdA/CDA1 family)
MGTSRTIKIDPKEFPLIGVHQYKQVKLPLNEKEFVLTLDDGPISPQTKDALDFLKKECAKATFFLIGRNVRENPDIARRIATEGHTVGTHTQTHAYLNRISYERAVKDIDDGFRVAQEALDPINMKVAPFFRFPGLISTPSLEAYLQSHGISSVSTDVLASDWFHRLQSNPQGILQRAVARLEEKGSGILLLHDVKKVTVAALPELFKRLKERGFKLVHMVPLDGALPIIPPATNPTGAQPQVASKTEKTDRTDRSDTGKITEKTATVERAERPRFHHVGYRHARQTHLASHMQRGYTGTRTFPEEFR